MRQQAVTINLLCGEQLFEPPAELFGLVGTSKAERLRATLAAPPGMKLSRTKSTIGTGASGEIRATWPQMNWSSITSPTTRIRARLAAARRWRTREGDKTFCFMSYELNVARL